MRRWRVFYTFPRAEKKCESRLAEREVEVFLPKHTVVRQWSDRKKKVVEPLFRNYIFARVDERERLLVLQVEGIVRCVGFDGRPAELTQDDIEQIRIAQTESARISVLGYPLPALGEDVTIVEGPLQGLHGQVMQHRGQTRLAIVIPAIRQALTVEVDAAWIRTAKPRHHAA